MPVISVVMPVYNGAPILDRAFALSPHPDTHRLGTIGSGRCFDR